MKIQKIVINPVVAISAITFILLTSCRTETNPVQLDRNNQRSKQLIETTQYYDNRKAVVIFTADDWCGNESYHQSFITACQIARKNNVVISPGILPGGSFKLFPGLTKKQWGDIQNQINQGSVCPISHSMTHPGKYYTYTDHGTSYQKEIAGSKQSIIDNLTMPVQNCFKSSEYMVAWMAPYGTIDEKIIKNLTKNNYLVSRSTDLYQYNWAKWDNKFGMYLSGLTIDISSQNSLDILNSEFNHAYDYGGIYHVNMHPGKYDWSTDEKAPLHLEYIGNRNDVWYVGFDHAYMYHYLQDRVKPTIKITKSTDSEKIFRISVSKNKRIKYGLSYPITYKISMPYDWLDAKVLFRQGNDNKYSELPEKNTFDIFNGIDAYRKDLNKKEFFVSKAFPQDSSTFYIKLTKKSEVNPGE
ncbi:MAG TPA: hypothetical protein PLP05_01955 [Sedimentisphaerales bacterium]|nr:hypothetical protein [Sedimentisphaerales bacterium]